jgi:hypothetical protein
MALYAVNPRNIAVGATYTSPVATSLQTDARVRITVNLSDAQRSDPQYGYEVVIETSPDGVVWQPNGGGFSSPCSPPPSPDLLLDPTWAEVDLPPAGWQIRALVRNTGTQTIRIGFTIETKVGIRRLLSV